VKKTSHINFDGVVIRLKAAYGLKTVQQVAELLGYSGKQGLYGLKGNDETLRSRVLDLCHRDGRNPDHILYGEAIPGAPSARRRTSSDVETRLSMLEELLGVGKRASKDLARMVKSYLAADDIRKEEALKVLEQRQPQKKKTKKAG